LALAVEHPGHGVRGAQVATVPAKGVADLGDGAIGVVGGALDEDRGTTGAVPLVGHVFIYGALELAGALLDRAVDVVVRHVDRAGRVDRRAEARIGIGVAAAGFGRDGDFPDALGPHGGPARVRDRFLSLD